MFVYNELFLLSCLLHLPLTGHSRGSTDGNSPGDGAVPSPAHGGGKAAVQKGNPAEPAYQHQGGTLPGFKCKTLHEILGSVYDQIKKTHCCKEQLSFYIEYVLIGSLI